LSLPAQGRQVIRANRLMARSPHDHVHTSWFVFHCKEQLRNNGRSFLQPAVCIALLASTGTVAGASDRTVPRLRALRGRPAGFPLSPF
jgi:hypothetical protein